ncbi:MULTISPECIES: GH39 family glycosyl hydrolase [Clostridia]|uniref:GH39 family glycosyl hydrolase n=1 Tax=Clostridia TaxID=186801 RepID=UPI000E487C22|nr:MULTISPECIES: helix-turn-helix domain-containing protein [Clostridia]RGH40230.1 helix-turn-helix domain-containing protein [Firmicutes bacterium AM41-5BH]RKQ29793.1 helix-turn-helix domain-containing protein [Ruminococcus sp. B05]TAP33169.1 helix-turn-helix domain-containing protein [Mediterraneibacter sp. gm002]
MDNMRTIMDFEFDTSEVQNTHFHQNLEIVYVLEGSVEVQIEPETYNLKKGDFLLINANKRHSWRATEEKILLASFQINFTMLAEYMGTNQLLFWCNTTVDKNESYEQLKQVLDQMLNRSYDKEKEGAIYLNSIYYEAIYLLVAYFMIKADDVRMKENFTPDNSRIFEIQNYVQANYQKQLSLNDLAQKLYLSNAYLSKYIKKHFGLSFLEYVNNIRLFHAVDELVYSEKKITRIALDNGFPTTAAFNKAFKEIYNMTPSAYRSTVHKEENLNENKEAKQELDKRVKEYLTGKEPVADNTATRNMNLYVVDAKNTTEWKKPWDKIINMGNIDSLLNYDVQSQLLMMQKEIGFSYVRIYNIFMQDMYYENISGDNKYNFSRIDRGLDFLVEHNLKPYIELSFKPTDVNYTINSAVGDRYNEIIFHDRESYVEVMQAFSSHIANRYGVNEIESWYFELWKDDRLNMLDAKGWYFDCFEIGYHALKKISSKIKVGGAGFALGYDRYQYSILIQNWKTRNVRPDFISVYSYSYLLLQQDGVYFGKRSLDNSFVKNQLELFKDVLKAEDFMPDELHITEWNFTISNRNCINDSCAQGAYIVKTCIESIGEADMMGYWHGSDLHTEYYDSGAVLYGDNGLLTRDGIKKPSFYAFHFLKFLKKGLLGKTENALLTTDGRGVYTIACHNCKKFNYRYTMKAEKDIRVDDIDSLYEDTDSIHLKFQINNVENGNYVMRVFYVNEDNGSIQNIWKDMDYIGNLSKGEVEYMKRSANPKVDMRRITVQDNVLRIETKLKAHEIKVLDIHYQY